MPIFKLLGPEGVGVVVGKASLVDAIEKMTWMDDKELLNHCALTGSVAD